MLYRKMNDITSPSIRQRTSLNIMQNYPRETKGEEYADTWRERRREEVEDDAQIISIFIRLLSVRKARKVRWR